MNMQERIFLKSGMILEIRKIVKKKYFDKNNFSHHAFYKIAPKISSEFSATVLRHARLLLSSRSANNFN
jgi:hypothetical protein